MTTTEKGKMMKISLTLFGVPINQAMSKKRGWGGGGGKRSKMHLKKRVSRCLTCDSSSVKRFHGDVT